MSEQICDAFINISSDKKQCQLLKGHSGFHRMGQLEWNWPGQPDASAWEDEDSYWYISLADHVADALNEILGEVQGIIHDQWNWIDAHHYVECLRCLANEPVEPVVSAEGEPPDARLIAARKLLPYVYPGAKDCEKEILAETLATNKQGMVDIFYRAMDAEVELLAAREIALKEQRSKLPPLLEPYRQNPPVYSMIGEQQREKWRKQWAKMDAEDCERQHYKHYEWECRNTFEELEARERQLLAAREEIAAFKRVAEAWEETAAQHCRNEMFYHGIVTEIGEPFGVAAKTSDDGSIQEDVLALRVPELVTQLRQSHSNLLAFVKRNHTDIGWAGCPTCELISSAEALEGK